MKSDTENDNIEWIVFGCLFASIGALSIIPPLQDIMSSFFDPDTSVFVSLIFALMGVACFITYFFRNNSIS
ncbi:hypothetical protein [Rhodohalobacter barkolensis]|uniref:Uncharacterized protein n=1 Tax=Rhodohalobacter barkolensis TaxID=2053187 RepID=A0A2N0VKG0_9BACT|nr:hypothetical protein [Rhodohalobacter barkolensis]PKD44685.1 hypothetical protein CWD77_04265 [Rhodohalobacter barkolensis]